MNINNHRLEININGVPIDLFSDGINLRMNDVLTDPTKLTTTTASYSFTFNLPITPTNSKVFNYANASSKPNKFSGRYDAVVYADGINVFEGTLKISSIEDNMFKCNLYQNKVNPIETIFGDSTMNEISWYVPFKGTSTINQVNNDETTKYYFPLVAYSLFNKRPDLTTASGNRRYTDKYIIDNTNRFYYNSFVPSLNLIELLKKCCESKGYTLQGDILSDKIMNNIYLSNYIADEQDPLYNYGDTDMGEVSISIDWKNYNLNGKYDNINVIEYPLTFIPQTRAEPLSGYNNYDTAFVWNTLSSENTTVTVNKNASKMYVDGGVQIPADGYYEITMEVDMGIPTTQGAIVAEQCTKYVPEYTDASGVIHWDESREYSSITMNYNYDNMPIEVQLCRFDADDGEVNNINHNLIYYGRYPNESDLQATIVNEYEIKVGFYSNLYQGSLNSFPAAEASPTTTAVDVYNNSDFICGLSQSTYSRSLAYIKDGYSWHSEQKDINNVSLYNMQGYKFIYTLMDSTESILEWTTGFSETTLNENVLVNGGSLFPTANGRRTSGTLKQIVKLNKNDMLVPFAQTRGYYSEDGIPVFYRGDAKIKLSVRAVAPQTTNKNKLSYSMTSLFDKQLNLGNFNNNEQKMSDFFNDICKAFNLSSHQNGKSLVLNKKKYDNKNTAPIDIDDKTNTTDAIFNELELPRTLEVKYKIDTEEEGFYRSVEDNTTEEEMQSNNWKDYGDYGYSKVILSQVDDSTDLSEQINFSYNWNRDFYVTIKNQSSMVSIPVIGKTSWWIEGLDYEGLSQYDGRGFTQRMWFRDTPKGVVIPVNGEDVDLASATNYKMIDGERIELNYKNQKDNLLDSYFNIHSNARSGEVEIEVYLSPIEYKQIKNGASVHFDDDVYKVIEIEGFDPSGVNPTRLKMMKL